MTTKDILKAMGKGAVLCMTYTGDEDRPCEYFLHPSKVVIRTDVAEQIIALPGVRAGEDSLIPDHPAQTWRIV